MKNSSNAQLPRIAMVIGPSILFLFVLVAFIGQALAANGLIVDLENSSKAVDLAEAEAGDVVQYTILISNTGNMSATNVLMMDTLPAEAMYQTDSLTLTAGSNYMTAVYGENNGVITWTGTLSAQGYVALSFQAMLMDSLEAGAMVTNTAVITGTGSWLTRTASTTIIQPEPPQLFLPAIWIPLSAPSLQVSVPVNNQWTATWSNLGAEVTYELQESNTADFSSSTTYTAAAGVTSQNITQNTPNVYYYRVRGILDGYAGEWSPVRSVAVFGQLQLSVSRPDEFNEWTASWTGGGAGGSQYELQEDGDKDFDSPTSYMVDAAQVYDFSHNPSPFNYYCYRVRSVAGAQTGPWSNVKCVVGGYFDQFADDSTGWAIRREDTDDTNNISYYHEGDDRKVYVLEINGRWDYALASPLQRAPEPPYVIEAKVRLNEPDNLNTYGFVFGGDWNGSECPNDDFSSCFNKYYRLTLLYNGNPDHLRLSLKRIDRHEGPNSGRGQTLIDYDDILVYSPAIGYKTWRIEVEADGTITIFVNGYQVKQTHDTRYINNPYFGIFAASDEYLGAEPWYDWYSVMPLPEN